MRSTLMGMLKLILILGIIAKSVSICANDNLDISSANLVFDRHNNDATFSGNVLLCLNGIKISAEEVVFTFEKEDNKKINKITIPVRLRALRDNNGEKSAILADKGIYTLDDETLILSGNVIIEDKKEVIITDEMLYHGKLKNIIFDGK